MRRMEKAVKAVEIAVYVRGGELTGSYRTSCERLYLRFGVERGGFGKKV